MSVRIREGWKLPGGILSGVGSIDVGSGHGRSTTPKKGVFACNIDLLYDLISAKAPNRRSSKIWTEARRLKRLPDLDDIEIRVKRCMHAVPPSHDSDCDIEAYDTACRTIDN